MRDDDWMQLALEEARRAEAKGEVPVGSVLVLNGQLLSQAHNQTIMDHDPTAHAEILALRRAGEKQNNYRLLHSTLYVTLEPCLMCFSALVHARIARLVFAAFDPKTGVCGSCLQAQDFSFYNHRFLVEGGIMQAESAQLLRQFFQSRRDAS